MPCRGSGADSRGGQIGEEEEEGGNGASSDDRPTKGTNERTGRRWVSRQGPKGARRQERTIQYDDTY